MHSTSPRGPQPAASALLLALLVLLAACSNDEPGGVALAPVADPARRIADLEVTEELSEAVANDLIVLADALRRGADAEVRDALADDFAGPDPARLAASDERTGPLGIVTARAEADASTPAVGPDAFVAGLRALLAPFEPVQRVVAKLVRAEFAVGAPTGAGTVRVTILGKGADGGPLARVLRLRAALVEGGGRWRLARVGAVSLEETRRAAPLYADLSYPARVAHEGPAFGTAGNESFFWEGAASADVDGDGRFDLFVPSDGRNFLYRNAGDGTFEEVAEEAGVAAPGDGTAALLFDADQDGAVDLLVGHAGFRHRGDVVGGTSRLYRNVSAADADGAPRFEDVSEEAGFDALHVTFSLAAADADLDGFVDVHVASYNAEGFVAPDSWHEAANGTPNALYFGNAGGAAGRFEDRAAAAGVDDARWSYAAAFCDFDEDGDQDLYVANDFAANALYRNRGDGTFEDATAALGVADVGNGMGVTWGDHDADGDLDLYVANMSAPEAERILGRLGVADAEADALERTVQKLAAGNTLFTWNGERFETADVGATEARWAWAAQFDDLDLDGDQDLLCVNGFLSGPSRRETLSIYWRHVVASTLPERPDVLAEEVNSAAYQDRQMGPVFAGRASFAGYERDKVWLRDGGRYVDVSAVSGADDENDGRALVLADFDDDGDRDVFVHHMQGERHRLYRNDAPEGTGHRSVKVRLRAAEGPAEAMGAIVRATVGGRTTAQVLAYGSGFLSQNAPELVFGVGAASAADEVSVRWPGRAVESFGRLEAGRTWLLEEGRGRAVELPRRPTDTAR